MENSEKIFFEDDGVQWFVALGDRSIGPMSAADVYERIVSGKMTWAHFVWKAGQKSWTRVCDTPEFQTAVPKLPSELPKGDTPPPTPAAESAEEKLWFLYYSDSQYGPFSQEEVERFLASGRIHAKVHVWKDGMKNWERLDSVTSFKSALSAASGASKSALPVKEQRSAPRAPLVAKIMVASERSISVAMCRDISVGGMQVLTDRLPGEVSSKVKLNVSSDKIEAFVAEGVIVRILEDRRGFSFRFEKLPDTAKRAIEAYIQAAGV